MYVCIYVCMCVCMYIYVRVFVCVCVCVCVYIRKNCFIFCYFVLLINSFIHFVATTTAGKIKYLYYL